MTLDLFGGIGISTKPAPPPAAHFDPPIVHQGDAFAWLARLPDACADLIITDFPYASLELHRAKGTTTRLKKSKGSSNEWFPVIPDARLPELISSIYRVLKPNRHFYLFCDEVTTDVIKSQQFDRHPDGIYQRSKDGSFNCKSGFTFWRDLIYCKTTLTGDKARAGTGYHYRGAVERIMFFEKGKRKLNDLGVPDILFGPRPDGYPTEKDFGVVETLVTNSTLPLEMVLDPFSGSWVVAHAALANGRRAAGNDIANLSMDEAQKRLAPWLPPPTLTEPSANPVAATPSAT